MGSVLSIVSSVSVVSKVSEGRGVALVSIFPDGVLLSKSFAPGSTPKSSTRTTMEPLVMSSLKSRKISYNF